MCEAPPLLVHRALSAADWPGANPEERWWGGHPGAPREVPKPNSAPPGSGGNWEDMAVASALFSLRNKVRARCPWMRGVCAVGHADRVRTGSLAAGGRGLQERWRAGPAPKVPAAALGPSVLGPRCGRPCPDDGRRACLGPRTGAVGPGHGALGRMGRQGRGRRGLRATPRGRPPSRAPELGPRRPA